MQVKATFTIEVKDAPKPALVAECLFRYSDERGRPRGQGRRRHRQRPRARPRVRGRARRARARPSSSTTWTPTRPTRPAGDRRRRRACGRRDRPGRRHARRPTRSSRARSSEFGRLDVMVTNAGVLRDARAVEDDRRGLRPRRPHAPARHVHVRARGGDPDARAGRGRPDHRRRLAGRPVRQLRPDELRGREGRHRGVRADVGDGAGARGDHGQRDRPDRVDGDDGDHPGLRAARRARRGGRGRCRARCAGSTRSACPRTARRWSCSSPPTAAAGITGQAIGIGGDRLSM